MLTMNSLPYYAALISTVAIVTGLIFTALEFLVVPGFGFFGISGLLLLLFGIAITAYPLYLGNVPEQIPELAYANYLPTFLLHFGYAFAAIIVIAVILRLLCPKTPLIRDIFKNKNLETNDGYVSTDMDERRQLIGQTGTAASMLRPAGIAIIDGKRLSVITQGELVNQGTPLQVIACEGVSIIVKPIDS